MCSGEITDSAGVVLSPNWPEAYDKGQDCIWGIHVEEDKRIMLDIQVCVSTVGALQRAASWTCSSHAIDHKELPRPDV